MFEMSDFLARSVAVLIQSLTSHCARLSGSQDVTLSPAHCTMSTAAGVPRITSCSRLCALMHCMEFTCRVYSLCTSLLASGGDRSSKCLSSRLEQQKCDAKTVRAPDTMVTLSPLMPEAIRPRLLSSSGRQAEVEQESIHPFRCPTPLARRSTLWSTRSRWSMYEARLSVQEARALTRHSNWIVTIFLGCALTRHGQWQCVNSMI